MRVLTPFFSPARQSVIPLFDIQYLVSGVFCVFCVFATLAANATTQPSTVDTLHVAMALNFTMPKLPVRRPQPTDRG